VSEVLLSRLVELKWIIPSPHARPLIFLHFVHSHLSFMTPASATSSITSKASISTHYDVIIIGAGASGLICAAEAGARGKRVLVLEGSNKVGKKILMSGGGRCNFTNLYTTPKNFLSNNPHFCISALKRYTPHDFMALVEKHGIAYEERQHGQLFCVNSAKDILTMLLAECAAYGVEIRTHCKVQSMSAQVSPQPLEHSLQTAEKTSLFTVNTSLPEDAAASWTSTSLVVATGGLSIPSMGASGLGYDIARQFGHTVLPTRAGLVPFTFSDGFKESSERLSGLSVNSALRCHPDEASGHHEVSFKESILFTHRGLSGPAALQLSNYWQTGSALYIDLLPDSDEADWIATFKQHKSTHGKSLLRTLLAEHLPKNLVLELQAKLWPQYAESALAEIPDAILKDLLVLLKNWPQKPSGTEGYRTAEVTLGGVDTTELSSKTMESRKQAGLYFIGEVLDVTGHLGGFNFQWAWASGHVAGQFV
jgi:predicted Rossmann fold flavoprotein